MTTLPFLADVDMFEAPLCRNVSAHGRGGIGPNRTARGRSFCSSRGRPESAENSGRNVQQRSPLLHIQSEHGNGVQLYSPSARGKGRYFEETRRMSTSLTGQSSGAQYGQSPSDWNQTVEDKDNVSVFYVEQWYVNYMSWHFLFSSVQECMTGSL